MDISRVMKDNSGRLYIQRVSNSKRDGIVVKRDYGEIRICKQCEKLFFKRHDKVGEYCSNKCQTQLENHPMWKGGRRIHVPSGYILVKIKDHPNADSNGFVYEHRVIAESKVKRFLETNEHVHHVDGNVKNNSPENLIVMNSGDHMREHWRIRREQKVEA